MSSMSPIAQPTVARRPTTVTIAAALLALLGDLALIPTPGTGDIPRFILIASFIFAALKLVAAIGLWRCRKWAAVLGFVVVLLDALAAAPGLFFAPSAALRVAATVGVVLGIATLVLLVLPASRRTYV